jgi:hypothetical protein
MHDPNDDLAGTPSARYTLSKQVLDVAEALQEQSTTLIRLALNLSGLPESVMDDDDRGAK